MQLFLSDTLIFRKIFPIAFFRKSRFPLVVGLRDDVRENLQRGVGFFQLGEDVLF